MKCKTSTMLWTTVLAAGTAGVARGDELRMEMNTVDFRQTASEYEAMFNGSLSTADPTPASPPDPTMGFDSFTWTKGTKMSDSLDEAFLNPSAGPGAATFWSFRLGMSIEDFDRDNDGVYDGIQGFKLRLEGTHVDGPHGDDIDPNVLTPLEWGPNPRIPGSKFSRGVGSKFTGRLSKTGHEHPVGGGGRPHTDRYGVGFRYEVGQDRSAPLIIHDPDRPAENDGVHLYAVHEAARRGVRDQFGMTTEADTFFGFNVDSGDLFFSADQFNAARRQPDAASGEMAAAGASFTDPEFADDPFLGSFMSITPVTHLGMTSDGLHEFTGGSLFLTPDFSKGGTYEFSAEFDAMFFDPIADVVFAILSSVTYLDELDQPGFSPFLDQFTQQHLFRRNDEGIQLVVPVDLDGLTNNFTSNFFSENPTPLRLTGALVPEPATIILLGLGGVLMRGRPTSRRSRYRRQRG